MKNAIGGIFSIQALLIFIVLACGLLLFSVNYAKSFRVKNEVRRIVEKYEGLTEEAQPEISVVFDKYGYTFDNINVYRNACTSSGYQVYQDDESIICYKCTKIRDNKTNKYKGTYFTIATFVNVNVPVLKTVFEMAAPYLRIEGETAQIYPSGNNSELWGCQFIE